MALHFSNPLTGVGRCPQCNVAQPLLEQKWLSQTQVSFAVAAYWAVFECSSCHKLIMAEGNPGLLNQGRMPADGPSREIKRLYPAPISVDASLPPDAQRYLKQAIETKFAPDAAVVMAASAVDAMLKAKGYSSGTLYSRIAAAIGDHVLTEDMGKWAHKVRLEANAVRHADEEIKPPTKDDAGQVIEFASALGDFLFVFTARVEEGIKEAEPEGSGN